MRAPARAAYELFGQVAWPRPAGADARRWPAYGPTQRASEVWAGLVTRACRAQMFGKEHPSAQAPLARPAGARSLLVYGRGHPCVVGLCWLAECATPRSGRRLRRVGGVATWGGRCPIRLLGA